MADNLRRENVPNTSSDEKIYRLLYSLRDDISLLKTTVAALKTVMEGENKK